ncbi:S9 family peptidase [candidate division KSB1 bacterium]|nr:S9 family peptidase [candidate division KSB1 bacterium]
MKIFIVFAMVGLFVLVSAISALSKEPIDPFLWLENIDDPKALEWVEAQNAMTVAELQKHPDYSSLNQKILKVLNSRERIAYPTLVGDTVYNFWQDADHPRGIWRRTPLADYFNPNPKWETVLDIDQLSRQEEENWAFKGAVFLWPSYDLCLVNLSRGGSDAVEIREFDPVKKAFIEQGFFVPQAKGGAAWIDRNTLLISTDFGPGTTTASGYPRIAKIWQRGTPLSEARTLYEGQESDMGVWGSVLDTPERSYVLVTRMMTFYTGQSFVLEGDELIELDIPDDARFSGFFKNQMLVELKSDWIVGGTTYEQGALISIDYDRFRMGERDFSVVFAPAERSTLDGTAVTRDALLVLKLTRVVNELFRCTLQDGRWVEEKVDAPDLCTIGLAETDPFADHYFFSSTTFLCPTSLYYAAGDGTAPKKTKSLPPFFDAEGLMVEQFEVASTDGVSIPYFVVRSQYAEMNGANPTLLYGYGGFEIPMQPVYSPVTGTAWLERGGVYVVANIRGGGEFGPRWHQSALKENRQRAFDDFLAVAEDLIRRQITSPRHLGIKGGSNGGLLVGVAFTQRPDLFNAVLCSVPLLDMQRYNKLLAGASWMGEYGDPDVPEEWAFIRKYSPYHNLVADTRYPRVFFTTTTRDDRVHPGHARKMAAKMEAQGHPFFYFENTEGGHGSGVTNEQRAQMLALEYIYLIQTLGADGLKKERESRTDK